MDPDDNFQPRNNSFELVQDLDGLQTPNSKYNSNFNDEIYVTNINELISEPASQSISFVAANYILSSLFSLSNYLFQKKFGRDKVVSQSADLSFQGYLKNVEEGLTISSRGKKSKGAQYSDGFEEFFQEETSFHAKRSDNIQMSEITESNHRNLDNSPQGNRRPSSISFQSQLLRRIQRIPYVFFEKQFFLDFSQFDLGKTDSNDKRLKEKQKIQQGQELLNENLDIVEINLFRQIHRKFHEYFKVVANFDYLRESIAEQLMKLAASRRIVQRVRSQFVDKSSKLRLKIIERQNIEKLLKNIKVIKSLKKLPTVIESILQSSLPYECLQLLQKVRSTVDSVKTLTCMNNVTNVIEQCQKLVQLDLNKRYGNELYLYLEECHIQSNVNLVETWRKIDIHNCLDKDNSVVMELQRSYLNNSGISQRSGYNILQELQTIQAGKENATLSRNHLVKRNEGKQYEIAMILLQSYDYISFTTDTTRIKVCNSLRVFVRRFERTLAAHFKEIIKLELQGNQQTNGLMGELQPTVSIIQKDQMKKEAGVFSEDNQQAGLTSELLDKISVDFYIKHVALLNDVFKETINRFLGYMLTLLSQYEDRLIGKIKNIIKTNSNSKGLMSREGPKSWASFDKIQMRSQKLLPFTSTKLRDNQFEWQHEPKESLKQHRLMNDIQKQHPQFKRIFAEKMALLPSIFKIIEQRTKNLLCLKNISHINSMQFYWWISTLRFWQKYFDFLVDEHPFVNYVYKKDYDEPTTRSRDYFQLGQSMIEELVDIIHDSIKRSITAMALNKLLLELTTNYIDSFHKNTLTYEIENNLNEETWQSAEIPREFSEILCTVLSAGQPRQINTSITILDSSAGSNMSKDSSRQLSREERSSLKLKFKVLKNNILLNGVRYKLTLSFMVLCQQMGEYMKMSKLLANVLPRNTNNDNSNEISRYVYIKLYEIVEFYCKRTKELILDAKVLALPRFKSKSVNVRHICILDHCICLIGKITGEMLEEQSIHRFKLSQIKKDTLSLIETHHQLLLAKLSIILQTKIDSIITSFENQQRQQKSKNTSNGTTHMASQSNSTSANLYGQTSMLIINALLQMIEIIDEYFDISTSRRIMRSAVQVVIQKYITVLLLRGDTVRSQLMGFHDRLKFLKKYLPEEIESISKEIQSMSRELIT